MSAQRIPIIKPAGRAFYSNPAQMRSDILDNKKVSLFVRGHFVRDITLGDMPPGQQYLMVYDTAVAPCTFIAPTHQGPK